MSLYLRWGGAAVLMIAALLTSRAYESYLKRRIGEYRGLVSLIAHAEGEISKFLAYGEGLWRNFRDDALEKCGLLESLREGASLQSAFDMAKEKMSLSKEAAEGLSNKLSLLGKGYKDGELSLLSSIKEELSSELDAESAEAEKNIKVARALLLGGALCVAVMVL